MISNKNCKAMEVYLKRYMRIWRLFACRIVSEALHIFIHLWRNVWVCENRSRDFCAFMGRYCELGIVRNGEYVSEYIGYTLSRKRRRYSLSGLKVITISKWSSKSFNWKGWYLFITLFPDKELCESCDFFRDLYIRIALHIIYNILRLHIIYSTTFFSSTTIYISAALWMRHIIP